ncbi:MAG: hypothetical protein RLZZ391_151 [Bacteroidota bacterium]|jgi:hypothetical protein
MKTRLIALLIGSFALFQVQAQKVYSTKAAVVRFIAEDDKDIDATNTKVVSRLEPNGKLSFIMLMKDFSFDMETMQEHFNKEYVESDKFPRGFFNGQITNIKSVNFAKDGKYPVTVNGNMQVHGVNKAIQTNGFIEIIKGQPKATAKFTVTLKDFGIGGLLIKMVADKVDVEVVASYQ